MSKAIAIAAACAAISLGGCATTDFGLPDALLADPPRDSLHAVTQSLRARRVTYVTAADDAANAPQYFDVPLIALATTALGAAVFDAQDDTARIAGVTGTGILGLRNYYQPGSRYAPYVGGARALSCLVNQASSLSFLSTPSYTAAMNDWMALRTEAGLPVNRDSVYRDDALRLAPLALGAVDGLADAAARVDDEVVRRLGPPSAPDISGMMASYEANFASAHAGEAANAETAEDLTQGAGGATVSAAFDARAERLLADQANNNRLVNLAADLDRCVTLAVG